MVDVLKTLLQVDKGNDEIKIGMLEMTVAGDATPESKEAAESATAEFESQLITAIKESGLRSKFALVERSRLNAIIEEQKLSALGLTENTALSIGGIANLDYLIMPTAHPNDNGVDFYFKVLSVKNASTIDIVKTSVSAKVLLDEKIEISAGSRRVLRISIPENEVSISIDSDHNVSMYLVDQQNLNLLEHKKGFTAVLSKEEVKSSNFDATIANLGNYFFVISNTKALLLPAHVKLKMSTTVTE